MPRNLAGLGVERIHTPLAAFEVAAGVADEDEAVPCDRRRRHTFALRRIRYRRLPEPLAGLEVIGQHPTVVGPAEQRDVEVGGAPIGRQNVGRIFLVGAPVLDAGRGVDRENIEFDRTDERPLHHD